MRYILKILSFIGLLVTWFLLFFILSIFIEFTFAPWDSSPIQPAVGTWQYTLNAFFDGYGSNAISALLLLANAWMLLKTLHRRQWKAHRFLINNILFFLVFIPIWLFSAWINHRIFPHPPLYDPNYIGYHLSVIPGIVLISMILLWMAINHHIAKDTRKRKNHARKHDIQEKIIRLTDRQNIEINPVLSDQSRDALNPNPQQMLNP